MKDRFSKQSAAYSVFRPTYPAELFDHILSHVEGRDSAWDCATGNGQVAAVLSKHFRKVAATDISENQIHNAPRLNNVSYSIQPAEHVSFPDHEFDLITVAQAIHWFDFRAFYSEVRRVLKPGGLFAAIGYHLCTVTPDIDRIILNFYGPILESYWDPERKHIDARYSTIPFPFQEIPSNTFSVGFEWNVEQMIGFLETWSAVRNYMERKGANPLDLIERDLRQLWGTSRRTVTFPFFVRMGKP